MKEKVGNNSFMTRICILPKILWVQVGLLMAAFVFLCVPVFPSLLNAWWESDANSHGFLVPFISLYLVWARRNRLKHIPIQPDNIKGIPVVLLAGFMFLVGNISGVNMIQAISLIVIIVGLVLMLMGTTYLKVLSFPIAYLLFMVPYLESVMSARIHWPFQLLAAKVGTVLLQILGIPVILESQYILLPNRTLEVAVECSGINYLTSILAIGIPLAYITQKTWKRKVSLVSIGVAIAILANSVRVAFVGILVYYYNPVSVHGPFHIFQGILVAITGFVALFVGAWILSRIPAPLSSSKDFRSKKPL